MHSWPAEEKQPRTRAGDGGVEVGVGQDEHRVLAAELERAAHELARRPRAPAGGRSAVEPVNCR